jgi:ribosomal protein S18 acetylase RimI-like enzyme
MEIANQWAVMGTAVEGVRLGEESDAGQITRLLREAPFTHVHADWHYLSEWLGRRQFMLVEDRRTAVADTPAHGLFSRPAPLLACLAVAADPPPAAWVRVGAINSPLRARELLAAMLARLAPDLRDAGVQQIGWLMVDEWPDEWLNDLGFEQVNAVMTYVRSGAEPPPLEMPDDVLIRPVVPEDLPLLEQIEAEAFEPLWRHSAEGLALAVRQTVSFDVAERDDGRVLGFQFSTATRRGAHLSRMTVDPAFQRSGIGSALLAHALVGYQRQHVATVTLNTQVDNIASQRLYERFGFRANGESFPVWAVSI